MNKTILVYCELTETQTIADVSLELCSKARKLADELQGKVETVILGSKLQAFEDTLYKYGVDKIYYAEDKRLFPYLTLPHKEMVSGIIRETKPYIVLFGATETGRDLAPRVSATLKCGLTADCTKLEIGNYTDTQKNKTYENLLYQIRPAFGGNIIASIINAEAKPQMATVREGIMRKECLNKIKKGEAVKLTADNYLSKECESLTIIKRHIESSRIDIKNAQIIVSGGFGMGSKQNFRILHEFANMIGGEVGATRAAVDAGFTEGERQIGQTGISVHPKLYIACGISGAIQHRSGMEESAKIISINTDISAPINTIADYVITGDVKEVIPKLMRAYASCKK